MKLRHRSLLVLGALVIATGALAYGQTPAPQSGPSDLLDVYKNATTTWVSTAFGYANKLFGLLAVIDFTWAMIVLFLERHELEGWIAGFLKKLMTISFFYALLINQSTWFPAIINSFVQIGQQAGGVSGYLNPSSILWTGVQISGAILAACLPSATAGATAGGIVGVLVPGAGAALTAASLIPALVALFCALLDLPRLCGHYIDVHHGDRRELCSDVCRVDLPRLRRIALDGSLHGTLYLPGRIDGSAADGPLHDYRPGPDPIEHMGTGSLANRIEHGWASVAFRIAGQRHRVYGARVAGAQTRRQHPARIAANGQFGFDCSCNVGCGCRRYDRRGCDGRSWSRSGRRGVVGRRWRCGCWRWCWRGGRSQWGWRKFHARSRWGPDAGHGKHDGWRRRQRCCAGR